jgi:hypothetical protein
MTITGTTWLGEPLRLIAITGTTWLDFLIWVGVGGSFSTTGYFIGRISKMNELVDALEAMTDRYHKEASDHFQSRIRMAKWIQDYDVTKVRDKSGQLPDEYTD